MKKLKTVVKVVLALLLLLIIATLLLGGFMPLFSIAFGIIFIYYIVVYFLINLYSKKNSKALKYIIYFLFVLPFLLMIIDFEGFLNFLLQGIEMDMK